MLLFLSQSRYLGGSQAHASAGVMLHITWQEQTLVGISTICIEVISPT